MFILSEQRLRRSLYKRTECARDDPGVKVANILYNLEGGAIYCILDAPDKKAVEKHHSFLGLICDTSVDVLILLSSPWAWDVSLICTVAIYSF